MSLSSPTCRASWTVWCRCPPIHATPRGRGCRQRAHACWNSSIAVSASRTTRARATSAACPVSTPSCRARSVSASTSPRTGGFRAPWWRRTCCTGSRTRSPPTWNRPTSTASRSSTAAAPARWRPRSGSTASATRPRRRRWRRSDCPSRRRSRPYGSTRCCFRCRRVAAGPATRRRALISAGSLGGPTPRATPAPATAAAAAGRTTPRADPGPGRPRRPGPGKGQGPVTSPRWGRSCGWSGAPRPGRSGTRPRTPCPRAARPVPRG